MATTRERKGEARAAKPSADGLGPQLPDDRLEAWRALLNAHAALVARIEEALADEQLPPLGWYDVLWALYRAPDNSLRPRDLGLHLTISKSGLTRLVDRIVAAGLIERCDLPTDRRGNLLKLTDAGRSMLREMQPVFASVFERQFGSLLSKQEARTVRTLMERLETGACDSA